MNEKIRKEFFYKKNVKNIFVDRAPEILYRGSVEKGKTLGRAHAHKNPPSSLARGKCTRRTIKGV